MCQGYFHSLGICFCWCHKYRDLDVACDKSSDIFKLVSLFGFDSKHEIIAFWGCLLLTDKHHFWFVVFLANSSHFVRCQVFYSVSYSSQVSVFVINTAPSVFFFFKVSYVLPYFNTWMSFLLSQCKANKGLESVLCTAPSFICRKALLSPPAKHYYYPFPLYFLIMQVVLWCHHDILYKFLEIIDNQYTINR